MAKERFDAYLKRLDGLGLKKMGRGATATVYQHPAYKDVVAKVGLAKPDSQGYEWLRWCTKNQNSWTPRVYSLHELDADLPEGKKGRMFVAFMERLDRADPAVIRQFFAHHKKVFPKLEPRFWGFDPSAVHSHVDDMELRKALRAINRFRHCDFKLENVMMRGSQIVFSDPVY